MVLIMVRPTGLEPAPLARLEPKSSVSANSTTAASLHIIPAAEKISQSSGEAKRRNFVGGGGETSTPDDVMIQGFPLDDQLEQLRSKIRSIFHLTIDN